MDIEELITKLKGTKYPENQHLRTALISEFLKEINSISENDRDVIVENLTSVNDINKLKQELIQLLEIFHSA